MSHDPRAALALARLLEVLLALDADQLGDLTSMAEEMAFADPAEPDPDKDPREATRRARAEAELVDAQPEVSAAPALDHAAEVRLVLEAQRRLEQRRAEMGLTRDGERRARQVSRGGAPQVAREAIRTAIKAKGTH